MYDEFAGATLTIAPESTVNGLGGNLRALLEKIGVRSGADEDHFNLCYVIE